MICTPFILLILHYWPKARSSQASEISIAKYSPFFACFTICFLCNWIVPSVRIELYELFHLQSSLICQFFIDLISILITYGSLHITIVNCVSASDKRFTFISWKLLTHSLFYFHVYIYLLIRYFEIKLYHNLFS